MGSLHFELALSVLFCSISLAFLMSLHGVEGYACHAEEREALLSLRKVALSVRANGAWMKWEEQEAECCEWLGVRCDEVTGRVVSLQPAGCDSTCDVPCGALPSSLTRLESLQVLDLRGACFSGAIPALPFPNLTYLDLSYNFFWKADQLLAQPPVQVQLLKLTYLNLSDNGIESLNLSQLVRSFPNVQYLDLSRNHGKGGAIPEHLSSLHSLAYLDISENDFRNPVPWQSLGRLSHLRYLGLGSEDGEVLLWEERKADWPCTWKSLESLLCINMGFRTSAVSAPLVCLEDPTIVSKLKSLSFTSSSASLGPLLRSLSLRLNHSLGLKSLSLEGTSLGAFERTDQSPSWSKLLHAPFLETLVLGDSGLTSIPLWLHQLPLLQSLDISGNNISDFSGLHTYPLLKSLDLSDCNLHELPRSLLRHLPSLETLNMAINSLTGFPAGLESLVHLRELDMSYNNLNGTLENYQGALLENCTQLTSLDLSYNNISGVIPQAILNPSLVSLYLSNNRLFGAIPHAIGNLSLLSVLSLSQNLLTGAIPVSIGNLSSLVALDLSANSLSGAIPASLASNWSLLWRLDLSANHLSGAISFSVENCPSLDWFSLSSNNLTGVIPHDFFQKGVFFGDVIDLSHNKFRGSLPQIPAWQFINMSYNEFSGSISPSTLSGRHSTSYFSGSLSLSNNRFSGSLLDLLHECDAYWYTLDLSSNNFSGALPWEISNCSGLQVLNLGGNSLSSRLPASLGQLNYFLQVLILGNNRFSGEIPGALQNCTGLRLLDLSYNQIRGRIPEWITGENFGSLQVLMLSNNQFHGSIPLALLQNLTSLQILALASNSLSGFIPSTVDCLQGMTVLHMTDGSTPFMFSQTPEQSAMYSIQISMSWKGSQLMIEGYILNTLAAIDLSDNFLEGNVPPQIGALQGLGSLNLSHNKLSGPIPSSLGNLSKALQSLDLSYNQLTGDIPHQLCDFYSLGSFNISNNQLRGEIPQSSCTPMSDRDASSFANNDGLCGYPLPNQCLAPPPQEPTTIKGPSSPPKHSSILAKIQDHIALGGVGIGYVVGFVIARIFLHFKYRQQQN